jgi:hypothetical protein
MIKMVTKQNIIHWHMLGMSQRSIARQVKHSLGVEDDMIMFDDIGG